MRLLGMGLPTYVLQIDIRQAFPSAGREDVLESMRARGLGGAWLAAFWRLQEMAGVKLSTACGGYSGKVNFERGLLEGRVMSGVKLAVRGGTPLWVGAIMKTDDILILGKTENEVRLAYGVVLAWCNEMRFEHAPEKTRFMLTGHDGAERARLNTVVVWSWAPGELEETLLYRPYLKYLGDYFDCMMNPSFALTKRFGVAEGILASMNSAAESIYFRAMCSIMGTGVASYYPHEVVRKLAAISKEGPRAKALACFQAYKAPAFVKVPVTHAMARAASALGVALPNGNEPKAEWKSVVRVALDAFEKEWRS
ncbi:hypothetical protein M885DRAFT_625351, partial [Pelagophyceae sp. CCMP2097]